MTNPDQLRAAFEAWARRGGWSMKLWPSGLAEYISTATEAAWQGYIAGHAAALAGVQPVRATPEEIAATELTPEEFAPMEARLLKSLEEQRAQVAGEAPALSDERIAELWTAMERDELFPFKGSPELRREFARAVLAAAAPDHSPGVGKMVPDAAPGVNPSTKTKEKPHG